MQRKNGSYSMNQLTEYTNFMSFLPSEDCVQEKQITNYYAQPLLIHVQKRMK